MGFLKNIFSKKKEEVENVGGMEDFMTLIRVYLQAVLQLIAKTIEKFRL